MSGFSAGELTHDGYLGGLLHLHQPRTGYRAGVDPVLLAASVPAVSGQTILELGCGAGAVILCLGARVPGLELHGVELQADYADLARQNASENNIALEVTTADLSDLPSALRQISFDHVLANPPYFRAQGHTPAQDPGRRVALGEATPLADWVRVAAKRLAPKGFLHIIQRTERLPELLAACAGRLGSVEVLPLAARTGRSPDLVIMRARKSGRAAFVMHAPVILHQGIRHAKDENSYTIEIERVLRDAKALNWQTGQ